MVENNEINIMSNKLCQELMKKLLMPELTKSYLKAKIYSNDKISILGIIVYVEFVNGNDGDWFEIIELKGKIAYLKRITTINLLN